MSEIILYPTETVYALGVNPLDEQAWQDLCTLKQRSVGQTASWLVRDLAEVERYAALPEVARQIADTHLPGPLTLVLAAKDTVPQWARGPQDTVSFRISSDPVAQALIAEYTHPLTCTSANVHGLPTLPTSEEIKEQFGARVDMITKTLNDGARAGTPSTVVRVIDDQVELLRPGVIVLS